MSLKQTNPFFFLIMTLDEKKASLQVQKIKKNMTLN